jgi:hypothetical protein
MLLFLTLLPPTSEQEKIEEQLDNLNQNIQLLNKINTNFSLKGQIKLIKE